MSLISNSFNDSFSMSADTLSPLQKSAIEYLFSDPRLDLIKLNDREYMEAQIAYRSRHDEQEIMLESTLQAIEKEMFSQEDYSILSIGCGSGIFEKPFLEQLLRRKKTINFVGIDPNDKECLKLK